MQSQFLTLFFLLSSKQTQKRWTTKEIEWLTFLPSFLANLDYFQEIFQLDISVPDLLHSFFLLFLLEEIPFRCAGRNTTLRMVVDFFFAASFFTSRWSKSIKPYSSPSKLGNSPGMWSRWGCHFPGSCRFRARHTKAPWGLRGSFVVDSQALFLPAKESDAKLWGSSKA